VNDRHSHFIDTGVGDSENEAFRQSITLTGGDEEATIALNDVVAKSVVANSDANIEIAFDSEADEIHSEDAEGEPVKTAAENFGFTIQTGGGNDVVDMSEVVLTRHASIDLGDGEDRLVITNGNDGADAAITPFLNADGVLSDTDSDQIFKGVRNVEILEFHGDDRLKFNDDASAAGFERLVVGRESSLYLDVLQAFQRDSFAVEIGDRVEFDLDVWNDANYELTAEDRLRARIAFNQEAAGNLKLHADDSAK